MITILQPRGILREKELGALSKSVMYLSLLNLLQWIFRHEAGFAQIYSNLKISQDFLNQNKNISNV